jgi:hypothetical protein
MIVDRLWFGISNAKADEEAPKKRSTMLAAGACPQG